MSRDNDNHPLTNDTYDWNDERPTIRVVKSPFLEDDNLPWDYSEDNFIAWYDEVFREGYKRKNPEISVPDAIQDLRNRGYEVECLTEVVEFGDGKNSVSVYNLRQFIKDEKEMAGGAMLYLCVPNLTCSPVVKLVYKKGFPGTFFLEIDQNSELGRLIRNIEASK